MKNEFSQLHYRFYIYPEHALYDALCTYRLPRYMENVLLLFFILWPTADVLLVSKFCGANSFLNHIQQLGQAQSPICVISFYFLSFERKWGRKLLHLLRVMASQTQRSGRAWEGPMVLGSSMLLCRRDLRANKTGNYRLMHKHKRLSLLEDRIYRVHI